MKWNKWKGLKLSIHYWRICVTSGSGIAGFNCICIWEFVPTKDQIFPHGSIQLTFFILRIRSSQDVDIQGAFGLLQFSDDLDILPGFGLDHGRKSIRIFGIQFGVVFAQNGHAFSVTTRGSANQGSLDGERLIDWLKEGKVWLIIDWSIDLCF